MNLKDIQNLIRFVAKSGASEVELETEDVKIRIKTAGDGSGNLETVVQHMMPAAAPVAAAPAPMPAAAPAAAPAAPSTEEPVEDDSKYVTIKSPMIGTFYRKPSPDKDSFVQVGSTISADSVVCVIEAMKLFNEIEAEVSGKIVKVLADDSSPVEYDQPLFLVDPS